TSSPCAWTVPECAGGASAPSSSSTCDASWSAANGMTSSTISREGTSRCGLNRSRPRPMRQRLEKQDLHPFRNAAAARRDCKVFHCIRVDERASGGHCRYYDEARKRLHRTMGSYARRVLQTHRGDTETVREPSPGLFHRSQYAFAW